MTAFGEFRLRESIEIDRPASVVWPYLIAFEQVPRWEEGVIEVRQLTAGEPVVGTRIEARRVYGGRVSVVQGVISAYEPGRAATMAITGGPVAVGHSQYAVHPIDDERCQVVFSVRATMRGPMRLLHPILPAIGRSGVRRNLARLRRRVLAGIPPGSDMPTPVAGA
jgi:Polyketide cyclase / dehydrase and lipid transport